MIKTVRPLALSLIAAMALIAPGAALAATADPAPCIWNHIPAAQRDKAMVEEEIGGVGAVIGEALDSWSPDDFTRTMAACKVKPEQQDAAAALLATHVVRIWSEASLADSWTAAELNRAYSKLQPAQKALLSAGTAEDGTEPPGYEDAVKTFFGPLEIESVPSEAIKMAFIYLITRLKQDESLAAYSAL